MKIKLNFYKKLIFLIKMNNEVFYLNRIIKIISPFTFQTFKIELNGEENELRELLATILEVDPNSIKGIRDSYNNYYTLSSAVKNPHINTNPYNYYTVVIKNTNANTNSRNIPLTKSPSYNYNLLEDKRIHTLPNENNINYHTNFLNNTYNFYEDNNGEGNINMNNYIYDNNNIKRKNNIKEYLNFADDLYKKNYIDNNLIQKLKRLILENNKEVLGIMSPYINIKSHRSYDEFAKKIIPIISYRTQKSESINDSKFNFSSSNSDKDEKKKKKDKISISQTEKILEDIKHNFSKKEYSKIKKLYKNKDKNLIKIFQKYQNNKDYNKLLSKIKKILNNDEEKDKDKDIDEKENEESEKTKKNKNKSELNDKDIKKISKNITNSLKNKGIDIYYISKYDLDQLNNEEKISLFKKKFKLPVESIIKDNYKIPKKNISTIKKYYSDYINKKIKKNFDENDNIIYEGLLEQEEENNFILKYYKDLLKHKNLDELKNQIKQIIKETVERIQEEEGEEEEDDEEEGEGGKTLIKEENENEEEEDEEGEEEEEDEKDSKNEDKKSSSNKSSDNDNIIILNNDNKDRGVNLLNNNYRKINNYNYNNKNDNSNNDNDNENDNKNKDEKNSNKDDDKNLGLGFVVVKQKKTNTEEENKIINLNNVDNKQNESSVSTNNPNKKLNQFIQQIEHLKKIDDIKETIINAINNNNKYAMDLFQKFQKNKFCLNPKSLNELYKQIKENPQASAKDNEFKSLIKEMPNLSENIQEFICDEFINNKNSELETYFNLYDESKDKDEFFESIEMFMNKPATKKLLNKFNLNEVKKEIGLKLSQKNDKSENLVEKSKEIIKILQKYNLFSEKEFNVMKKSLTSGDKVFTAGFQVLFDNKDFDDFYETITIALENHINKGDNKK